MVRNVTWNCDRCRRDKSADDMITFVEVSFGGSGAMRDTINDLDLCRDCYRKLVLAIRFATGRTEDGTLI